MCVSALKSCKKFEFHIRRTKAENLRYNKTARTATCLNAIAHIHTQQSTRTHTISHS